MSEQLPFVSVIIPHYNDPKRLALCLEALAKQSYPVERFEVIVVDNASTEDISDVIQKHPTVRFASEKQKGSYAARNLGLKIAKGDVLAFTDSDCIPAVDWLEKGVECLASDPQIGLVAGAIQIFFENPTRPTPAELYEALVAFPQQDNVELRRFGATANVLTRRNVFEKVGPFRNDVQSGGDFEWGQRVYAGGFVLKYSEATRVNHPARATLMELWKKSKRVTLGQLKIFHKERPDGGESAHFQTTKRKSIFARLREAWNQHQPPFTKSQKLKVLGVWAFLASARRLVIFGSYFKIFRER